MIYRPSSNLGHVGSKTRSLGQAEETSDPCSLFLLMIYRPNSNLGHVGSTAGPRGQLEETFDPFWHCREHIPHPIFMNLGENVS